jgi:hypothetical protein
LPLIQDGCLGSHTKWLKNMCQVAMYPLKMFGGLGSTWGNYLTILKKIGFDILLKQAMLFL